jgi:hypothetical protein
MQENLAPVILHSIELEEIIHSVSDTFKIVTQLTNPCVAVRAKPPSMTLGFVAMIPLQFLISLTTTLTRCTKLRSGVFFS